MRVRRKGRGCAQHHIPADTAQCDQPRFHSGNGDFRDRLVAWARFSVVDEAVNTKAFRYLSFH